jgi:hypothetical protein
MRNGHADEIGKLIEPGRVHRRVYTDPESKNAPTTAPS